MLTEATPLLKFTRREFEGLVRNRVDMIVYFIMNVTNRLPVSSPTHDFSNKRNERILIKNVVNMSSSKEGS